MSSRFRFFAALMLIIILASAAYAFADANVVQESGAGDGFAAISGYTTGAIHYSLTAANPQTVDSVSFTLTPTAGASAPTVVKVWINDTGSWTNCTLSTGTWTCSFSSPISVATAVKLRVVAAQ